VIGGTPFSSKGGSVLRVNEEGECGEGGTGACESITLRADETFSRGSCGVGSVPLEWVGRNEDCAMMEEVRLDVVVTID